MLEVLDIFNNPIGWVAIAIAVMAGGIIWRFAKTKTLFIWACGCFVVAMGGLGLTYLSRSIEFLAVFLFFIPISATLFLIWLLKLIVKMGGRFFCLDKIPRDKKQRSGTYDT